MPNNIEREIVQMVFDARDFVRGIQDSIRGIEELKESFDLENARQSMGDLAEAGRTDFSPMSRSLDSINSKLSLVGVAAATLISNVTTAVLDSAKRMADALILDPIRTGLEEYETQLNAVQTILANTAKDGTTLGQVTAALDELNSYADLTIYNFTQMTDSIGKFTTAGVDLDTSVEAIKGIANVAAISGSNAQQASTAMYQLSQALSSGVVKLQDWISIENAGMGGELFKDALLQTLALEDIAKSQEIASGSFRDSLSEGWLTSDILLATLDKFTGDLTDAELAAMGYADGQIENIQKTAVAANDAATKIKTLTQFTETMAEALQSGWGQTWRIIFGDFEQAKDLWGGIAEIVGTVIDDSADGRNSMLEMWAAVGGRQAVIQGFMNIIRAVFNLLAAFKQAIGEIFEPLDYVDLMQVSLQFMWLSEAILAFSENSGPFRSIVSGIAAAIDILRLIIVAVLGPILDLIGTLGPAGSTFGNTAVQIADAVVEFRKFAIETDFFNNIVGNIITGVGDFINSIKELVDTAMQLEFFQDVTGWLSSIEMSDFVALWNGILSVLRIVGGIFYVVAMGARSLANAMGELEIVQQVIEWFGSISWSGIKDGFQGIGDAIEDILDSVRNSDLLGKFVEYFETFDGRRIEQFFGDAREAFSGVTDILASLTGQMDSLGSSTDAASSSLDGLGEMISEQLSAALDFLISNAENIDYSAMFDRLFQILNIGVLAAIAGGLRSIASGGWLGNALESFGFGQPEEIGNAISSMFWRVEGVMTSFQSNIKADTLQKIAVSIALLAGSIILITLIDSTKLLAATAAIGAMVALLFGSAGALKAINPQDSIKAAISIIGLSVALAVMAGALQTISTISAEDIESSLLAMTGGLVALIAGVTGLSLQGDKSLLKTVGLMLALGVSLRMLTGVIRDFGSMKPETLRQGLLGIAAVLVIVVSSLVALTRLGSKGTMAASVALIDVSIALGQLTRAVNTFGTMDPEALAQGLTAIGIIVGGFAVFSRVLDPKGLLGASVGILVMTAALIIMGGVVQQFANMSWDELQRGLVGLGVSLLILVVAANALSGALAGAVAMLIMGVAITALSVALKLLSTLSLAELGIALLGMAGIFVVMGLAGLLLAPLIPVLIALGAVMLLIGAAALAAGIGLGIAATGLVAIGASAAVIAAGLALVGTALIELLPPLAEALAEAFVNFLTVIADNTPRVIEAMNSIVLGMIEGMTTLIPDIVILVLDMMSQLMTAILDRLPEMIDTGWEILSAFLQGMVDHIQDVVAMGLQLVTEIINGIAEGLPDLIDSAFNLILTFLNAIAEAIEEYMPDIIAAGIKIGVALVEGLVQGLMDGIEIIKHAIKDLIQQAIDRIKAEWGIASPSKVTYNMAKQVVQGFANGITDGMNTIRTAFAGFAEQAQNGIDPFMDAIAQNIDESLEFNPLIRPVMDLSKVTAGANSINDFFNGAAILANLTHEGDPGKGYSTDDVNQTGRNGKQVTYNQYNYSPESLDRASIYRLTKTHTARLILEE